VLPIFQTYRSTWRFLLSGFAYYVYFAVDSIFPDLSVLCNYNSAKSCFLNKIFAAKERKEPIDKNLCCFFFALFALFCGQFIFGCGCSALGSLCSLWLNISRLTRFSIIFPGIRGIREICTPKSFGAGQILKTPMVIKPSSQSKPALSLM